MTRRWGEGPGIFPRYSVRDDVRKELDSHVALRADELVGQGYTPEEAEIEARRLLGNGAEIMRECSDIVHEHHRAERRARIVDTVIQDVRYGVRAVARNSGFALVAVLTLALGIGANTAVFSVVNGVLLQPLPYDDSQDLMVVRETTSRGGTMRVAWANFLDWRDQNTVFDGLFAYTSGSTTVLGGASPVTAQVATISVDLWSALRSVPSRGRLTLESDHVLGAPPVVVVSESFWRNELTGRALSELRLEVNGLQVEVVGVVPGEVVFPSGSQVWLPIELFPQSPERSAHNWGVVGRLATGVSMERASLEMNGLTQRLVAFDGVVDDEFLAAGAVVTPLQDQVVGQAQTPLLVLLGASLLVLLIACTNLASTLLARGATRLREFAVRTALGAGSARLVRQLLTESLLLAAGGVVAGVAMAVAIIGLLRTLGPQAVPRLDEVSVDGVALLYAAVVGVATVLLFGLFPALRLTRGDAVESLRSGSRGNAGGRGNRAWAVLVGGEVALALVLLVGSGLLIRSFQSLLSQDAGFDGIDVMTAPMALSRIEYPHGSDHAVFYEQALDELASLPGVSAAGVMSAVPMGGGLPNGRLELDGDVDRRAVAGYVVASAGAFEALDVPLLQGRLFDRRDTPEQPHVAIVSEAFALENWPNESPIGRSVTGGGMDDYWEDRRFAEVVGVVGDVRFRQLGEEAIPTVYFPFTQRPFRLQYGAVVLVESADGVAESVGGALRSTLQRLAPDVPLDLDTQQGVVGASLAGRRFTMLLLGGFSLIALTLSVIGIYGVVSYAVARRTREMGIRLALGADAGGVVRLVVRSAMNVVILGLMAGTIGAVAAGRLLRGMLFGVGPMDPVAIGIGVAVLAAAAGLASWVPARRGTRVDPMLTMRAE